MVFKFDLKPGGVRTTANPPTVELTYVASGEFESLNVKLYAVSFTPAIVTSAEGLLYRQDIQVQEQGHKLYHVIVPYAEAKQDNGSIKFNFSTTGGSFHITHSLGTVQSYGSSPPNHNQAIGVRKSGNDMEVDGSDIVIPALKLSYTFRHPQGVINEAFARNIARLTGSVNSAAFRGFDAGEVLFLGGDGSDGTDADAECTLSFACEQNLQGLVVGAISGIAKQGHDLIWIQWKDNAVGGKPVKEPLGIYVERVYKRVDLSAALGF